MFNEYSLSVVVPVYNSSQFLFDSLNCLKKQLINNVEFIIVNDGSLDDSERVILNFIKGDSRFRYISKLKNSGYGDTCNLGISSSKGDYVAIFEPDDLIPQEFYKDLLEAAQSSQADIVKYNGIFKVDAYKSVRLFKMTNFPEGVFEKNDYPRFWRTHPAIVNGIYRKSFLTKNNIRFVTGAGASYQDAQYSVSLYYADPMILIVNDCKYQYRQHSNQSVALLSSETLNAVFDNWIEFFEKYADNAKKHEYWFANIQMYRQFISLNKRFILDENKMNIFYLKHVRKTGLPKLKYLRWFCFGYLDIVKYYWFLIAGIASVGVKK